MSKRKPTQAATQSAAAPKRNRGEPVYILVSHVDREGDGDYREYESHSSVDVVGAFCKRADADAAAEKYAVEGGWEENEEEEGSYTRQEGRGEIKLRLSVKKKVLQ